jgi:hypothetical protein
MWKIHLSNSIKTGQAQEGVSLQEEEEEDPRKLKIMIQEIHTSTADIMEGVVVLKLAQKVRRI